MVRSPTVYIEVSTVPVEALSISVSPTSGYVGDTFTFSGRLTRDGVGVAGRVVSLHGLPGISTGATDSGGNYSIPWVASEAGSFSVYAEA